VPWGQCHDDYLGQLSTKMAFFSKTNVMIKFLQQNSTILSQKANFCNGGEGAKI
jgi:hypothetical protein